MSHEIRTPINAIIGLDSIALRDESISRHTRDELTKIGSSARHLLSIINDILDMSRIESGRMELKEEVFSFSEFLEQIEVIVEDQEMNAEVLTDLLELEGMSSEWAQNGQIGVDMFAPSEEGQFAAILMDMRMPVMDGITATKEIRKLSRPDAAAIPIIALTANAFEEDVKQCIEAGMNAHLSKPVDIDRLKEMLGTVL